MLTIDFHAHILPGCDHGSRDLKTSLQQVHLAKDAGVDVICATSHFYAHQESVDDFLQRRNSAFETLRGRLGADDPRIRLGAEVLAFAGIERMPGVEKLCLAGTDLILIEMPFEQWDSQVLRDVEDIIYGRKMRVVLAHVERYVFLQRDKGVWDAIMDLPLHIQFNAGSFLRMGKTKRFCLGQVKAQDNVILGTDCHNMTDRLPNMAESIKVIEKKAGGGTVSEMMDNARGLAE